MVDFNQISQSAPGGVTQDILARLARINQRAQLATEKTKTFRGLLYGPSGTGKTTLAAMIARTLVDRSKGERIVQIDTSEGWVSWDNIPGLSNGIEVIPFESLEDVRAIAIAIRNKIPPYDTVRAVILDEASKMTEMDVLRVLQQRTQGAYGAKLKDVGESDGQLTEGPDYNIALQRFRELSMELYSNRDIHVILCAHQSDKKDRRGNIISIGPEFSPKIAKTVKEPLHLSAHITGSIQADPANPGHTTYLRNAQVHPTAMIDAKCRMNIAQVSVSADALPGLIKEWLGKGGEVESAPDEAAPDIESEETVTSGIDGKLVSEDAVPLDDSIDLSNVTI